METANKLMKKKGRRKYQFGGATFYEATDFRQDLPFLKPRPAHWLVRFLKPKPSDGSVIDDGDTMLCVEIDAHSGKARVLKGFGR